MSRRIVLTIALALLMLRPSYADSGSRYPLLTYSATTTGEPAQCNVAPAREQAALALAALNAGKLDKAYALAGSAWQYLGLCHRDEGDARTGGDAMLVIAIIEAQRGQHHLANVDSGIAMAEYQLCYEKKGVSQDDADYCHAMERKIDSMSGP